MARQGRMRWKVHEAGATTASRRRMLAWGSVDEGRAVTCSFQATVASAGDRHRVRQRWRLAKPQQLVLAAACWHAHAEAAQGPKADHLSARLRLATQVLTIGKPFTELVPVGRDVGTAAVGASSMWTCPATLRPTQLSFKMHLYQHDGWLCLWPCLRHAAAHATRWAGWDRRPH